MRLLEYEAKNILKDAHIAIPSGLLFTNRLQLDITYPAILKSQVPVGGRGKAGGIVIVETPNKLKVAVSQLLALEIKGFKPTVLLAEEKILTAHEHYLSLLIDRNTATIRLVAHKDGGIEVEDNNAADFLNIAVDETNLAQCAKRLGVYLGYAPLLVEQLVTNLYIAFINNDATLLEINPLIYTTNGELVCGDCKMELDDAAKFRHLEWNFEATPSDANFVTLDRSGTVATIANGAGLAMATVDAVAASGMKPANFLDIGGGANTKSILAAFEKIMAFPQIDAIIINIFAGITRCDEVARAIIEAKQQIDSLPPLFIRLVGTNFEEAVMLLKNEGIATLTSLEDCLDATKEATNA